MTDLERLDEALEALALWDEHGFDWKEARNRYESTMAVVRAYRNLLANGEPEWLPDELDQWWDSRSRAEQSAIIRGVADRLLGGRVEPDYEAAAEALFVATREGIAETVGEQVIPESWYTWDTAGPELREQYRKQAKATIRAAIGDRLLVDPPKEEER